MAEEPTGYLAPQIEAFRAVRIADSDAGPGPVLRLEFQLDEIIGRAMMLMARVDGRGFFPSGGLADSATLFFDLDEIPAEGAIIEIGFSPEQMAALPEPFSLEMIEEPAPDDPEPGGGV